MVLFDIATPPAGIANGGSNYCHIRRGDRICSAFSASAGGGTSAKGHERGVTPVLSTEGAVRKHREDVEMAREVQLGLFHDRNI